MSHILACKALTSPGKLLLCHRAVAVQARGSGLKPVPEESCSCSASVPALVADKEDSHEQDKTGRLFKPCPKAALKLQRAALGSEVVNMNQLEILQLEEYRCRKCSRLFYINAAERSSLDIDFGCPYACDDNGERRRDVVAEVRETAEGPVNGPFGIKDHHVVLSFSGEDFERSMNRRPKDQGEFDRWAFFMEKGLLEGNIDWDNVHECTREAMHKAGEKR
jgi:hypothetical protein